MSHRNDDQLTLDLYRHPSDAVQMARSLRAEAGLAESLVSPEIIVPLHAVLRSPRADDQSRQCDVRS